MHEFIKLKKNMDLFWLIIKKHSIQQSGFNVFELILSYESVAKKSYWTIQFKSL